MGHSPLVFICNIRDMGLIKFVTMMVLGQVGLGIVLARSSTFLWLRHARIHRGGGIMGPPLGKSKDPPGKISIDPPGILENYSLYAGGPDFRLYDGSDLKTYLLMRL